MLSVVVFTVITIRPKSHTSLGARRRTLLCGAITVRLNVIPRRHRTAVSYLDALSSVMRWQFCSAAVAPGTFATAPWSSAFVRRRLIIFAMLTGCSVMRDCCRSTEFPSAIVSSTSRRPRLLRPSASEDSYNRWMVISLSGRT